MGKPFSEELQAYLEKPGDIASFIWSLSEFDRLKLAALCALGSTGEFDLKHHLDLQVFGDADSEFTLAHIKAGLDLLKETEALADLDIAPYGPDAENPSAD